MAWTTPKTWVSEPLLSSDLNTHLRDNLQALKEPPTDIFTADGGTDYSIGVGGWADFSATDFNLSITPTGDTVLIGFSGVITYTTDYDGYAYFDILLNNSSRLGGVDGLAAIETKANGGIIRNTETVSFFYLLTGLTPNEEITLKLQGKITYGFGVSIHANETGGQGATVSQFWVREVS